MTPPQKDVLEGLGMLPKGYMSYPNCLSMLWPGYSTSYPGLLGRVEGSVYTSATDVEALIGICLGPRFGLFVKLWHRVPQIDIKMILCF